MNSLQIVIPFVQHLRHVQVIEVRMASLADRITKPASNQGNGDVAEGASSATPSSEAPGKLSTWADEAEEEEAETRATVSTVKADTVEDKNTVGIAQMDGASEAYGGEPGVVEPSYEVEIKLADIQANPNDPLYSIKSFEQLGL